ncbi:MAG: hypothetical protein KGJ86_10635, partial [Chloroflexota bacterium]|nr:hypothetical protein [Chloroflexota bacterium]
MASVLHAQQLEPTPTVIEGPYYKLCSPHRSCLVEPDDPGTRVVLTGHVYTTEGRPVPNAIVDAWSSDGVEGNYDMVGYKFRGHVFTDAEGRY